MLVKVPSFSLLIFTGVLDPRCSAWNTSVTAFGVLFVVADFAPGILSPHVLCELIFSSWLMELFFVEILLSPELKVNCSGEGLCSLLRETLDLPFTQKL